MDGTAGGPFVPSVPREKVLNLETEPQESVPILTLVN